MWALQALLVACLSGFSHTEPNLHYAGVKDELFDQPVNLMTPRSPHLKPEGDGWPQLFEGILAKAEEDRENTEHNRIKRKAKNLRSFSPDNGPKIRERPHHYVYPKPMPDRAHDRPIDFSTSSKKPPILPEAMNPGVVFRVRMSDAILRIKQRMYEAPDRHMEADIIYTNLIKKVVTDEITKFHNLLLMYKTDRSIKEHLGECGGRIYKFISYMTIKVHIYCLFDSLWIDGNPYVIGDEYSVTPVEAPPVLQCDAAECNSVVFVDSITEPKDRRRGRVGKKRKNGTADTTPENDTLAPNGNNTRRSNKNKNRNKYDTWEPPPSQKRPYEAGFVDMPKDLYQAHLRPGVIFRIHMSEAILKMQYRTYAEDKDESVIEADVEYLRLTRKVISDELTKFEDLAWLTQWFSNRTDLIQEHICNTRYYAVGTPPTMFTHPEEYMKRFCLFDGVFIDHIPYVVGEDGSLMASVAPPVLHCDAATCTSVPFIDSMMFDERLPRTNVRTVSRCQASCRAHCKNDPDCLKRCSDRCQQASMD